MVLFVFSFQVRRYLRYDKFDVLLKKNNLLHIRDLGNM